MSVYRVVIAPVSESAPVLGFNVSVTQPDGESYGRVTMDESSALRWAATELEKFAHRHDYHSRKV